LDKKGKKLGKQIIDNSDKGSLYFVFTTNFAQKYIVDKRIDDTFKADNRIKWLKHHIGMTDRTTPDAIGLQEVDGETDTDFEKHIMNTLRETHHEFEFKNSPRNKMHGGMFLDNKKFQLLKDSEYKVSLQKGDRIRLKTSTRLDGMGISGKTGVIENVLDSLGKIFEVQLDGETKIHKIFKADIQPYVTVVQAKKFDVANTECKVNKPPSANYKELDFQGTLVRTVGVVVPVKLINTDKIIIFGSFHFKSGKEEKRDRCQRYYDCHAFLKAVDDVKAALRNINEFQNRDDFPTFLFGDANADGNTVKFDAEYAEDKEVMYTHVKPVQADGAFVLARKKYTDLFDLLTQRLITSWKRRLEGVQLDKAQVGHKIYGDPCWYNNKWATPCKVTMPWLESQLIHNNKYLDNDNFCMIRPEHPSDHCSISQTFLIHRKKNRQPMKDEVMREKMLPWAWKWHNQKLQNKLQSERRMSRLLEGEAGKLVDAAKDFMKSRNVNNIIPKPQ